MYFLRPIDRKISSFRRVWINALNGRLDFHSEAHLKFRMSVQIALMTKDDQKFEQIFKAKTGEQFTIGPVMNSAACNVYLSY